MKPRQHRLLPQAFVVCIAPLLACANANARVLFANESNGNNVWTLPSGTNLLTLPESPGVVTHEGSDGTWATVIDGSLGDGGGAPATSCTPNNGNVVTFPLDLTGHPGGRDITSFDSYCSWGNSGRDNQDYTLQYETVANPGVFITISAVSVRTGSHRATHTRVTDTNGILAPGAKSLRLIFASNGQENGYVGYREFIALDAPVVVAVSNEKNNTNVWPNPSGNLLLPSSSAAPTGNEGASTDWNLLIDGTFGDHTNIATSVAPSNGQSVVFPLDLTGHPAGRDITTFDAYAAWVSDGRDDMHFTLEYDQVGAEGTFLPITAIANTSEFVPNGGNRATHSSVRTNTGVPLATGVNSIRITFNGQENGYEGFREFIVRDTPYPTALVNEANNTGSWTLPAGANLIGTTTGTTVSSGAAIHEGSDGSWDRVRDGLLGDGTPATSVTPNNNDEVTFTLDTSINVFGYNLTSFDSYCEWANSGRDDQDYTLSYSIVGDESNFIPLQVVRNHTLETKATHSRTTPVSGVLATNVAAIRLRFAYNQENGFTGFREFVALGSAVPLNAPITWTGTTSATWDTTANNWTGPYNAAAPLTFAETGINRNINVPTTITAASLSFTNTSSPFTIGGSAVTVSNDISSTGSGLATFNNSISAATGVSLSGSGSLVFNADLTAPGITLTGTGSITLSAPNPTLTGSVSVSNGVLNVTNDGALATSSLSMTGGTAAFKTSTPTVLSIGGTAGSIVLGDSSGPVNTVLSVGDIATVSTGFAGSISNALGATSGLTKTGESSLTLTGTNSYTGVTTVTGGTLAFGKLASLYGGIPGSWTGNIVVGDGATFGVATGGAGEFADSDINSLPLNGFAPGSALGVNTSADTTLSQNLPSGVGLTKTGSSILNLTGANGSSGLVKIISGTVNANSSTKAFGGNVLMTGGLAESFLNMNIGANDQFSPGSVLNFENGNFYQVKFNLRGTSQTLAGLDAPDFPLNRLALIQNDELGQPGYTVAPGPANLTINTATDHSFIGIIRNENGGVVSLTKEGPGIQELRNSTIQGYGFTGNTTINEGTLKLRFSGANSYYSSNVVLGPLGTLAFSAIGTDNNFGNQISGSGLITVTGTNVVRLSNRFNSFSSGVVVGSPEIDSNNGFLALVAAGGPQGAGTGLGQVCAGGAMIPTNVITVNGGATLALDGIAPLGESTMLPQYAPSVVINNSRVYGQNVVFVPNLTLNNGDVEIREGAGTGGYNTNLSFVGTVVVGGDSTLPSTIHVTNPGTYSNVSLGSNGLPGTTFQVANVTGDNAVDLTVDVPLHNVGGIVSPLTKTGPGTMSVVGTSTYTGKTTVTEGQLRIDTPYLSDNAGVSLSGSGRLFLFFDDTDTVASLTLEGVPQLPGVYGAEGNENVPLENRTPLIQGDGMLNVSADPYIAWSAQITVGDSSRTGDPDGDGFINLQEYLFGTSPNVANGSLSTIEDTGSGLIVRWNQRATGASVYELQQSTNLTSWVPSSATITNNPTQDVPDYVRKQATIPVDVAAKFVRVFATE
ncbi:MAG: autotransporter-associated beta strand repeat-containing protein [Verrucomicrobiota bacterium]